MGVFSRKRGGDKAAADQLGNTTPTLEDEEDKEANHTPDVRENNGREDPFGNEVNPEVNYRSMVWWYVLGADVYPNMVEADCASTGKLA